MPRPGARARPRPRPSKRAVDPLDERRKVLLVQALGKCAELGDDLRLGAALHDELPARADARAEERVGEGVGGDAEEVGGLFECGARRERGGRAARDGEGQLAEVEDRGDRAEEGQLLRRGEAYRVEGALQRGFGSALSPQSGRRASRTHEERGPLFAVVHAVDVLPRVGEVLERGRSLARLVRQQELLCAHDRCSSISMTAAQKGRERAATHRATRGPRPAASGKRHETPSRPCCDSRRGSSPTGTSRWRRPRWTRSG